MRWLRTATGQWPPAGGPAGRPLCPAVPPAAAGRRHVVGPGEIDTINILQAAMRAMEGAAAGISASKPDFFLVDGNRLPKVRGKRRRCRPRGARQPPPAHPPTHPHPCRSLTPRAAERWSRATASATPSQPPAS